MNINKIIMPFFFTFLISITLLGSVAIGPFSIRVYATIAMMLFLFYKGKKGEKNIISIDHGQLNIYVLFLVLMCLAQLLNGEIIEYQFFKKLLAYHLVSIVTFFSIEHYLNTAQDLKKTIIVLTGIMLFNSVATILQFIGNDIGWSIGMFFGDVQDNIEFTETHNSLLGFSRTPGIFGGAVSNAFAIAVLAPLSLCLIDDCSTLITKIYAFVSFIIAFIACFMTQQRAAFYLLLFCLAVYLFVAIKKNAIVFVVLGVLAILFVDEFNFDNMDLGRLSQTTDDSRSRLYKYAYAFISEHPILGGPMSFQKMAGLSSHNVALDSWIFAGFLGFVTMMVLICKTLISGIKTFINGLNIAGQDRCMIFCSIAVINAMVYGFTHNTSYLTGNVIIFIALALMLKSSIFNNN